MKGKRFLPEALQQELRRLHQQLGTVRLSEKLAVAPQTLRSMLLVERQTPKMIERVEQMLPQVCGYAKETKDHRSVLSPLYLDRLRVLMQITRLHQLRFALDATPRTVHAACAGFREMSPATVSRMERAIEMLFTPPWERLQALIVHHDDTPLPAQLPGLTCAETHAIYDGRSQRA